MLLHFDPLQALGLYLIERWEDIENIKKVAGQEERWNSSALSLHLFVLTVIKYKKNTCIR